MCFHLEEYKPQIVHLKLVFYRSVLAYIDLLHLDHIFCTFMLQFLYSNGNGSKYGSIASNNDLFLFSSCSTLVVVGACAVTYMWVSGTQMRGLCVFPMGRCQHVALTRQALRGQGGSRAVSGQLPLCLMREWPVN